MNTMKTNFSQTFFYLLVISLLGAHEARAQAVYDRMQGHISLGFTAPILYGGTELLASKAIRDAGQSYYRAADGTRRGVGSYGSPTGYIMGLGFLVPIAKVRGLLLGMHFYNSLTGTTPSAGGYAEGYYFNYMQGGFSAKFYPLRQRGLFAQLDAGLGSVLTKNRYLDDAGAQQFLHQFGIGQALALSTGYTFTPFGNKNLGIEVKGLYQYLHTRVEVNGLGDDNWRFGALSLQVGIVFLR